MARRGRLWCALPVVFSVVLGGCASPELVVLLEGEDGATGSLVVERDGETLVLDQALAASSVDGAGRVREASLSEAEIRRSFAAALSAEPEKPVAFTLYFFEGETEIAPESQAALRNLFAEVDSRQVPEVQVTGHTDRVGKVEDNDVLAMQRAERVRALLIEQGLAPDMVSAVGRGERELLVPTEDEVEEPRNRRVEVIVR
jgi:outer membrane protein OmpA-like peptidoglycan-associated protein